MMNSKNQIKAGVLLSYLIIAANAIYSLFITPFILKSVGDSAYGVYKSISSLSTSLAVIDLGLGTTITRYIAHYNATNEKDKASSFVGMMLVQTMILSTVLFIIGIAAVVLIPSFYANSFNSEEIILAKSIMSILILNMVLRMLENLLFGIVNGCEHFGFSNSIKLLGIILKFSLILILLPIIKNVKLVVILETCVVLAIILIFIYYILNVLKLKPKFEKWDLSVFRESFGYTILMFIQSITIQFNGNVDNVLIGAKQGSVFVTIYSMALLIFTMYENLAMSVSNVMLPKITRQVVNGDARNLLQRTVEKAGRYQFMVLAAALGGFVAIGKEFFLLWTGKGYSDCYLLTLILIIPVTFPMIQNVSLSILRAENKMVFRTVSLVISCVANVILTIIGINLFGYWGAAIGTGCGTILNLIMMNIYYHKVLEFKIFQMFWNIMKGIFVCALVAAIVVLPLNSVISGSWFSLIAKSAIYIFIYAVCLLIFGMTKDDKKILLGRLKKK